MDIDQFLEKFGDILWEEHKETIEKSNNFLKPYINMKKIKSQFGEHYISCPWSNNNATEGPDTCECYFVWRRHEDVQKLIKFYHRLTKTDCGQCLRKCDLI